MTATTDRATTAPILRPATEDDLPACGEIWRVALNDYLGRLNQPDIPDDLTALLRLYRHLRASDPERFVVAVRPATDGGPDRLVAFASALVRDRLWFLSMLFVLPAEQRSGLGRALLARVLPSAVDDHVLATGTDSAQPISNALYSTYGMVPRMPLLRIVGSVRHSDALVELPGGITVSPMSTAEMTAPGGPVEALDRDVAGFSHPQDHAFLEGEARRGFLYRGPDGRPVGYGYTSEAGRVGPAAVSDPALLAPVVGHLLRAVQPRGAFGLWLPGAAGEAVVSLFGAGLQLEPFPILLCWTRPFADFSRYLPISPGLL